jgi:hypothetical protein
VFSPKIGRETTLIGRATLTPPDGIQNNMRKIQINRTLASGAMKVGAVAVGAAAVGALAIGAAAVGALAIGVLTMRRLRLRKGRLGDIHIQRLTIGELDIQSRHDSEKP